MHAAMSSVIRCQKRDQLTRGNVNGLLRKERREVSRIEPNDISRRGLSLLFFLARGGENACSCLLRTWGGEILDGTPDRIGAELWVK